MLHMPMHSQPIHRLPHLLSALLLAVGLFQACAQDSEFRDEDGLPLEEKGGLEGGIKPPTSLSGEEELSLSFGAADLDTFHNEVPNYELDLQPLSTGDGLGGISEEHNVSYAKVTPETTSAATSEIYIAPDATPDALKVAPKGPQAPSSQVVRGTPQATVASVNDSLDRGERQKSEIKGQLRGKVSCSGYLSYFEALAKSDNVTLTKKRWKGIVEWQGISGNRERSYFLIFRARERSYGKEAPDSDDAAGSAAMLRAERGTCEYRGHTLDLTTRAW